MGDYEGKGSGSPKYDNDGDCECWHVPRWSHHPNCRNSVYRRTGLAAYKNENMNLLEELVSLGPDKARRALKLLGCGQPPHGKVSLTPSGP